MYLVAFIIAFVAFIFTFLYKESRKGAMLTKLKGRHVFITGGSKGIGLDLAKIALQHGAHVTIVARNQDDLDKAKIELLKLANTETQKVLAFSVDVSESHFNVERVVAEAEVECGQIFLLACCAGNAIARKFEDSDSKLIKQMMDSNYFGVTNTIKACLPSLKKNYHRSHILIFSSLSGLFGFYGYPAYSAAKFALVGLAECLSMEFRPYNISVTVSFPPDTDTPGFKDEQVGKPEVTRLISEEGGLFPPARVARRALVDAVCSEFVSYVGLNGFVMTTMACGMMPTRSWLRRTMQVILMGPFRLVGLYFLYICDRIILRKHGDTKEHARKKSQ